ncbi:conserved hypothetical protein [Sporisorium reilianum SRZ2]|uniref:Uncharacterized protein n=1 Tax=Sporisorium reilianum (strain SRZ2) TaxID=999809 RepID=E7A1I2_SPORE|nr:conserved hypothetical protein [Sporisorium reilianum SRZ2]
MDYPSVSSTPSRDRPPSASSATTTRPASSLPSIIGASGSGSNDDSHSIPPCADTDARRVASSSSTSHRVRYPFASDTDAADSRFDSLQDLLERAGYKETRVVTPDRQSLAGMFAKKLATPPRKPRIVDDFTSDSPSLAASELRRAIQKSAAARRSTPKAAAATSKSLPSRNYKLANRDDPDSVPPLPNAQAPASSGWFSNIWLFGPGTILNDASSSASTSDSPTTSSNQHAPTQQGELISTASTSASASDAASTPASTSTRAPPTKRTATNNPVWTASVAYRSAKSRTAPVRKSAAISSDVLSSDAAAEDAWKALHNGNSNGTAKRRPGLVDAFSSPTKKSAGGDKARDSQTSPSRQRKWRQERAAWRESLGDLQAMMDQSRMRREAAAAAAAAAAANKTAEAVETTVEASDDASPAAAAAEDLDPAPVPKHTDDDAIAKLLSGPALPFLSTDPAVAPRNASCTRPTHLSMRRMKSVEVLSKIMRERRTVTTTPPAPSHAEPAAFEVDTCAGQISPTLKKRSTPPRLTVSSPRGISSPKELALEGHEFEPTSWSPGKCGAVIISNRRVHKKPRSKLRHASSGSDLRSAAAADGLKIRRGRSKVRAGDSPTTTARAPVAALLRDSVGTLSRATKPAALRHNANVFDDDSPTRHRPHRVLALSHAPNHTPDDVDDLFRPTTKKPARITRTSKIMRLIEDTENLPSIAALIAHDTSPDPGALSSSLSRKSRERMHTITRVLGQKQPLAS